MARFSVLNKQDRTLTFVEEEQGMCMNRIAAKAIGLTVLFFLSTSLSALAPSIALDPVHDVKLKQHWNGWSGGCSNLPHW